MKNLILAMALLGVMACSEETPRPTSACNCGTIANDGIDGDCYWIEIRNNCSNNKKKFCIDQDYWMDAHVGTNFCITNIDRW